MCHKPNNLTCTFILVLAISANVIADEKPAVNVNTVIYGDVAYYPEHSTSAEIIAINDSKVSAEISAVVTEVNHDTGDKVSTGETVISLDCRTYELQLQQAKASHDAVIAQYTNAKKLFSSAKKLQNQNNISKELYNQREADASRFKAESLGTKAGIKTAEIAVEKCSIKAPFDGYVSKRFIGKGELTQPGTAVFQMVSSDTGYVEASINTFEYDSFLNGTNFRFVFKGKDYPLNVDSILPVLDKNFRTHTARLSFSVEAAATGSHGELKWRDASLALPSNLVVMRNGQAGVLTANSNTASFTPLDAYTEGHPAFIDLQPDTRIITTGRYGLKHGDIINTAP